MKLEKISAAGFRGIRSTISVDVPDGFLILNGRNGSGKSTLIDAVEFALTGRISRPALASEAGEDINSYIWWRGPGESPDRFVQLEFSDTQGQHLRITRRPQGILASRLSAEGNAEELNDADLIASFASASAPESSVLERLCATTIVRDEQITELSVDAAERARFSLVQDTLGSTQLPRVEERLKRAKQVLEGRIGRLEASYDRARAETHRLLSRVSEARSEVVGEPESDQARRNLALVLGTQDGIDTDQLLHEARRRLATLRRAVSVLSRCIPRLQEIEARRSAIETSEFRERDTALEVALGHARATADRTRGELELGEVAVADAETRRPRARSLAELLEHGRRLGLDDGRCPLCGSLVTEDAFAAHLDTISERLTRESEGLADVVTRREAALATHTAADAARRSAEGALRQHRRQSAEVQADLDELATEIRSLEGFAAPFEISATALQAPLDRVRAQLALIEAPIAAIEASAAYDRLVSEERALVHARDESVAVEKALETARRALEQQDQASRVVRRVAGELVDERLAQLEPLLIELYERIRPHVEWSTVGYRVRGDVMRFLRLIVGGDELNPRFMFSSGQRRALGLAFLLSVHLSTTWSRWNSLVLDDPMQHVDDYRALHLAEVLAAIRKSGKQVLCAVEDRALADLLARRLATSESETGALVVLRYELQGGAIVADVEPAPRMTSRLISAA